MTDVETARASAQSAIAHHARRLGISGLTLTDIVDEAVKAVDAELTRQHDAHLRELVAAHAATIETLTVGSNEAQQILRELAATARTQRDELEEKLRRALLDLDAANSRARGLWNVLEAIERLPYIGPEPPARVMARAALKG